MSDNDRPSLNRFALGEMPVISQDGSNRVLERTGLSLVTEMPVEAFHYFLNEVVQFAIDHWLAPKVTRAQIDRLRVCFEKFEELDLSQFDAAPLKAFIAAKEMNDGIETDGRIPC